MKITAGTPDAMALLSVLRKEGALVDVYSAEFFSRQPAYEDDPKAPFTKDGMQYIDELESDPESDCYPRGHLLFIFVDDYRPELRRELTRVYPPLAALIDNNKHNPDFLLLNLYTRQVLSVGLGRKNRLFVVDAASGDPINAFGLTGIEDHDRYMQIFMEHDPYNASEDLIRALHDLGSAMFRYDNEQATIEDIEHSLEGDPDENGLYPLIDSSGEPLTDELYTKSELSDLHDELSDYRRSEDDALKVINAFFPQCERAELNTGDY